MNQMFTGLDYHVHQSDYVMNAPTSTLWVYLSQCWVVYLHKVMNNVSQFNERLIYMFCERASSLSVTMVTLASDSGC
jgi:hypothetical protein